MGIQIQWSGWVLLGVLAGAVSGCGPGGPGAGKGKEGSGMRSGALASRIEVQPTGAARPSAVAETSSEVAVRATLNRKLLLETEFLYGADLQHSSHYDRDLDLYQQSLAIGHVPARFRIQDGELQLVADNRHLYPSDVNHPEQLLSRFRILAETENEITVSAADSGVFLAQVFEGTRTETQGRMINPAGKPPRDRWTRSFEYAAEGNYLLQETSVVLDDGVIAEFLEAIFPRANLRPSPRFEKFQMDPESRAGGDTGAVKRFRFIRGEPVFQGEKKVAWAMHFDLHDPSGKPRPVDWYVTRNIPDEYLEAVRQGVEGWNRYFLKMEGFGAPMVRFRGKLPEGVKLGDPRYNVINWDSRLVAGAAYESQAGDPETGVQSHSLIYLPAAWVRIGSEYWSGGRYSERPAGPGPASAPRPERAPRTYHGVRHCLLDMESRVLPVVSARMSEDELKAFGKQLLRGTLLHEVGHALGFDHNFKGSLSFDLSQERPLFSTSIMDYNNFEIERAAYDPIDSADGPLLEYDRQLLSALYNGGKDIRAGDPELPTCNDDEADHEEGGVDPLCLRYDTEKDPTLSILTAFQRIELARKDKDVTLAEALERIPSRVLLKSKVDGAKTRAEVDALVNHTLQAATAAADYFITRGRSGISRTVRTNLRSLLLWGDGVLPDGDDEVAMRERALKGVVSALGLRALPPPALAVLETYPEQVLQAARQTPYYASLAQPEQEKLEQAIARQVSGLPARYAASGLVALRSAVLGSLARRPKVPWFLGELNGQRADLEAAFVDLLRDALIGGARGAPAERAAAAAALATYRGRHLGELAIRAALATLETERLSASTNEEREQVERLIAVLSGAKPPAE